MKLMNKEPEMKLLQLIKYTDFEGNSGTFRLIETIQNDWRRLGTQLGIETPTLNGLYSKLSQEEKCEKILDLWMMRREGDYEVTWAGLLQALEDVQLKRAAKDLQTALKMTAVKQYYFPICVTDTPIVTDIGLTDHELASHMHMH